MLRTGVVSQRLVLQVVHMEQLVAETCRCDLSPSVSRPLRQREHKTMKKSFSVLTLKPFVPVQLQDSSPVLCKVGEQDGIIAKYLR